MKKETEKKPPQPRKYKCAMCNRTRTTEQLVRSNFTRNRYCSEDTLKCEELSRKRKRAAAKKALAA